MIALSAAVFGGWVAQAAPPIPVVGAVMEPDDVVEQYRAHAKGLGESAEGAELLCKPAVEGLQICAAIVSPTGWQYATHADPGVTHPTITLSPSTVGLVEKTVEGIGSYWTRERDDGREGLFFVQPGVVPVGAVVAWPVPGVVIAWVPGDPRLDQILSVGVARMVSASNHPISPKLYRYTDGDWVVWGEAKKPTSQ
jgi:hypothetical protein